MPIWNRASFLLPRQARTVASAHTCTADRSILRFLPALCLAVCLAVCLALVLPSCGYDENDPNQKNPPAGKGIQANDPKTGNPENPGSVKDPSNPETAGLTKKASNSNGDPALLPADPKEKPIPMPPAFVGNWFGYDKTGAMFLLTFTEDSEAALLRRSYRGETETIWEARPHSSGGSIRFGDDDAYSASTMPVDGAIQLSYKLPNQLVRQRVTLEKTGKKISILSARSHRDKPDPKALDKKKTEAFFNSLERGGRNWNSLEKFEESSHLVNPVSAGRDFAIRPHADIPIALPGAGDKRAARFNLDCLRRPHRAVDSRTFNIVSELHTSGGVQLLVEKDYLYNPALWEQKIVLHWQRAVAASELRDIGKLYVYLTDAKNEMRVISNIIKITAILTEQ